MIRTTKYFILVLLAAMCIVSCDNGETYGDLKKKERNAIAAFISSENIHVISEATFKANGNKTNVDKNEYVYLDNSGIYMQIVDEGCGITLSSLPANKNMYVVCRCVEYNIEQGEVSLRSDLLTYYYDEMKVSHSGNSVDGTFINPGGIMYSTYGASVPTGWLVPLDYIKVGRPSKPGEQIAYVRIIVPHGQGHSTAVSSVMPYHYEITYELNN